MLGGIISLASYGLGTGGTAGNILFQMEQQGVFAYILPFLLIFGVLFGILTKIKIFGENKGINIILSLSVALMALQMNFVSYFFREIFPRMGIMLSIILVVMVLLGLFFNVQKSKFVKIVMGIIMSIGVLVIIIQSFAGSNLWFSGIGSGWAITYFFQRHSTAIIVGILVVLGIVIPIVSGGSGKREKMSSSDQVKLAELRMKQRMAAMSDLTQDY